MTSSIEAELEIERVDYSDMAAQEDAFDRYSVGELDATLGYRVGLPVILRHAPGTEGLCEAMRPTNLCHPSDFQSLTGGGGGGGDGDAAVLPPPAPLAPGNTSLGNARFRICQPFPWGSKTMDGR